MRNTPYAASLRTSSTRPCDGAGGASDPSTTDPEPGVTPDDGDGDGVATADDCDDADPTFGARFDGVLDSASFAGFCDGGLDRCVTGDVTIGRGGDPTPPDGLACLRRVDGDVIVGDGTEWGCNTVGVSDLSGLSGLEEVTGNLSIECTELTSLHGLESLGNVGGSLLIGWFGEGYERYGDAYANRNDELRSLDALQSLTFVGRNLYVVEDPQLTSLSGLDSLSSVGTVGYSAYPTVEYGDLFIVNDGALSTLEGLGGLTDLGDSLIVSGNSSLVSLDGPALLAAIPGSLSIWGDPGLASLTGLEGLETVGRSLFVYQNASLASLAGTEGIASIGDSLTIQENPTLSSVEALSGVDGVGGDVDIVSNVALGDAAALALVDALGPIGGAVIVEGNE